MRRSCSVVPQPQNQYLIRMIPDLITHVPPRYSGAVPDRPVGHLPAVCSGVPSVRLPTERARQRQLRRSQYLMERVVDEQAHHDQLARPTASSTLMATTTPFGRQSLRLCRRAVPHGHRCAPCRGTLRSAPMPMARTADDRNITHTHVSARSVRPITLGTGPQVVRAVEQQRSHPCRAGAGHSAGNTISACVRARSACRSAPCHEGPPAPRPRHRPHHRRRIDEAGLTTSRTRQIART